MHKDQLKSNENILLSAVFIFAGLFAIVFAEVVMV